MMTLQVNKTKKKASQGQPSTNTPRCYYNVLTRNCVWFRHVVVVVQVQVVVSLPFIGFQIGSIYIGRCGVIPAVHAVAVVTVIDSLRPRRRVSGSGSDFCQEEAECSAAHVRPGPGRRTFTPVRAAPGGSRAS